MEFNKEQQAAFDAFVKASMNEKDKMIMQKFAEFDHKLDVMKSNINNITNMVQSYSGNTEKIITVICRIESHLNSNPFAKRKYTKKPMVVTPIIKKEKRKWIRKVKNDQSL